MAMTKKKTGLEKLIRQKAGARSVRFLDTQGGLHDFKAASLYTVVSDLKRSSNAIDRETDIQGVKVFDHPIRKEVLLLGLEKNAYHYRACKVKADYTAGSSYTLIDESDLKSSPVVKLLSKAWRLVHKAEGPIVKWFDQLGYDDYIVNILRYGWFDVEWSGDGYFEVIRNLKGQVAKIRHIPTMYTYVKVGGGFLYKKMSTRGRTTLIHYRDFGTKIGEQEGRTEMIHIRMRHPHSEVYGMPDIANAWSSLAKCVLIDENHEQFFANYAVPYLAVILEGGEWEDDSDTKIAEHLRSNMKGKDYKTLVLNVPAANAKIRFEPLGMNLKEGNFLQLKKEARAEIFTVEGVPPAKAGIIETGALAGESTQEQLDDFENTISIRQQILVDQCADLLIREAFPSTTYIYKVLGIGTRLTKQQIDADSADRKSVV